ncbi:C13 family peptidase [Dyadobacter sp. CY326]|uniref:C13 family peptidase n=1 Tax=Dyadobacter sp. CY326 TaxID=2907300 RepID=UPI001F3BF17F|nr:C13 family peptidase [Dyadobacter sp. CY326]MCE7065829.1 C13 family peptidase [Dyadobacter sp. CY326]
METTPNKSMNTVTSVFATRADAENAYQSLIKFGYKPEEITLIMSEETSERLYHYSENDVYNGRKLKYSGAKRLQVSRISDALEVFGRFVAIPGLALVVAGMLDEGGQRAIASTVLSDEYATYFQRRIQEGEILIDFGLHNLKERNLIVNLWENYGGYSLVRKVSAAA